MTFLENIERRQQALITAVKAKAPQLKLTGVEPSEGRTVGVRVPEDLRERLMALKSKLGAKTYKQVVLIAIEAGVTGLEVALETLDEIKEGSCDSKNEG